MLEFQAVLVYKTKTSNRILTEGNEP